MNLIKTIGEHNLMSLMYKKCYTFTCKLNKNIIEVENSSIIFKPLSYELRAQKYLYKFDL